MKKLFRSLALLLVMGNAMAQVPTNGLVAYYPFSGDVSDATGSATPGTSVNATLTNDRFGVANSAYNFNGTDSYLDLGINPSQQIQTNMISVSVWVKITGDGINYPRIFLGGRVNASYTLTKVQGNDDHLLWRPGFTNQAAGVGELYSNSSLSRNVWHHIVATYDGNTSSIYIDGKLDATRSFPGTFNIDNINSYLVGGETIAHSGGSIQSHFDGSIDDLRLYDRALDITEVNSLYKENCATLFSEIPVITPSSNGFSVTQIANSNYQWSFNNEIIPFNSSNILNTSKRAGEYGVIVSNGFCELSASYTQNTTDLDLIKGLTAFYPFSGNANDVGSNEYNGTVNNAVLTADRFGNQNSAYSFNGTNSSITVSDFPQFFSGGNYAISLWMKGKGDNGGVPYDAFIAVGDNASNHSFDYAFDYNNSTFNYWNIASGSQVFSEGASSVKDQWAHVVINYSNGKLYNYVNGQLTYSYDNAPIVPRSSTTLNLGGFPGLGDQFLLGDMDEVRIYNRDLTDAEIQSLYSVDCNTVFAQSPTIQFDGTNLVTQANTQSQYAWTYNGNPVSGQTSNTYTGTLNAGEYGVTVTNGVCSATASYTQTSDQVDVTKGLELYLPFNGDAMDASGNGRNGTIANGQFVNNRFQTPTNSIDLNSNGDVNFSSYNGYSGDGTTSFSISTWFKTTTKGARLISNGYYGNNKGYAIQIDSYGSLLFGLGNLNGGGSGDLSSSIYFGTSQIDYADNNWHHVSVIVDRFNSLSAIYIDGAKAPISLRGSSGGTITAENEIDFTGLNLSAENSLSFHIGNGNGNFEFFNGIVDETRIYSRALNPSEILTLAQEGCSSYFTTAPSIQFDGTNLVSTSYSGAQYAWTYNGNLVTGQNSNVYTGTLNAGEYEVTVTNGTCSATASYNQTIDQASLTNGLRAYYPFNGDATDASGNGNDGQLDGSPVLSTDPLGQANKAFEFNGSNRILIPNSSSLNVTNGISISTWIKQTGVNAPGYPGAVANYGSVLIDKAVWGSSDGGYRLDARGQFSPVSGKRMRFILDGNLSEASQDHEINKWQHLVVTYDLNSIKYYLNGVFISEEPVSKSSIIGNDFDLAIGGPNSTGDNATGFNFVGSVDEVRIYDRAINGLEVKQLACEFIPSISTSTVSIGGNNISCLNNSEYYALTNLSTPGVTYEWNVTGGTIEDLNASNAKIYWTSEGVQTIGLNYSSFCESGSLSATVTVGSGLGCGLELYLPFNGDGLDASGNSRDGIVSNGSFDNNRFVNSNSSLSLPGNESGVTFNNYNGYKSDGKGSFTLGTWFKAQPNGENRIISNGMNGNIKGYFLGVGSNGALRFAMGNEFGDYSGNFANSVIFSTQTTTYSDNNWHYVAVIVNREENKIFLWVDGAVEPIELFQTSGGVIQSDNSLDITGLNVSAETSSYLSIGNFENYGFFKGNIDETKIYSRALNTSEIQSLYTDGCPGFSASIDYGTSPVCQVGTLTPTGTFTGGYFVSENTLSINSVTGIVDLALSNAGQYQISYIVPSQYGCSSLSGIATLTIDGISNTTDATSLCADGLSSKTLTGSNVSSWITIPSSYAESISGNLFNGSTTAGIVQLFAVNSIGCTSTGVSFTINSLPVITSTITSLDLNSSATLGGIDGDSWSIISGNGTLAENVLSVGNNVGETILVQYTNTTTGCFVANSISVTTPYSTGTASVYDCNTLPFYIPIVAKSTVKDGIIGLDIALTFDPSIAVPTGKFLLGSVVTTLGQALVDLTVIGTNIQTSIAYAGAGKLSGSGNIISFEFVKVASVTEGIYTIPGGSLTESYELTYKDAPMSAGTLNVLHYYPTLSGRLIYRNKATQAVFNNTNSLSGVTTVFALENCSATGISANTDALGKFNVLLSDKGYSVNIQRSIPTATGVNTYINALDGNRVAQIANGKYPNPTAFELIAADVNGDGRVLSGDRTLIMNRSVLNIRSFPTAAWKFVTTGTSFSGHNKNNVPVVATCLTVPTFIQNGCTDLVPQTYSSILVGDVDGNYAATPNGANLRTEPQGIINLSKAVNIQPNVYRVPVEVNYDSTVVSVDIELDYNSTWSNNAIARSSESQNALLVQNQINNKLLVAVGYNDTLVKNSAALYIDFTTNNLDSLKLDFIQFLINGESKPATLYRSSVVTGGVDVASFERVTLYPNPSQTGTFNLNLEHISADQVNIEVVDMLGRTIFSSLFAGKTNPMIDLSKFDNGTYFVKIKSGDVVKVKSVIIEK